MALEFTRQCAVRRAKGVGKVKTTSRVFPPSKNG